MQIAPTLQTRDLICTDNRQSARKYSCLHCKDYIVLEAHSTSQLIKGSKMEINESLVEYIAQTYYNMNPILGSVRKLYGYSDKNYSFTDLNDHECYVLKLVNPGESQRDLTSLIDEALDEVDKYLNERVEDCSVSVPKLVVTTANRPSGFITLRQENAGQAELLECNFKLFKFYNGLTVFDFIRQHKDLKHRSKFYAKLGVACNQIFRPLSSLCHMTTKLRELRQKYAFPWDVMICGDQIAKNLNDIYPFDSQDPVASARNRLVDMSLKEFASIKTKLEKLPQYVLHGDLGTRNMLLHRESLADYVCGNYRDRKRDICIIDFQDIQAGAQIVDFANTLLYLIIEQEQIEFESALVDVCQWFLKGYQATTKHQLDPKHLYFAPSLMKIRLCQSLLNGIIAYNREPTNADVLQTNQRGWRLMELMCKGYTLPGLDGPLRECNSFKLACLWLDHPPGGHCKCLDDLQTLLASS